MWTYRTFPHIYAFLVILACGTALTVSAQPGYFSDGVSNPSVLAAAGGPASDASLDPSVLLAAATIAGAIAIVFLFWRGGKIEEVFLVHWSGVLIVHLSRTIKTAKDRDILAGMLTTIQQFAREAFVEWKGSDIRRIDLGTQKIFLSRGSYSYLAAVVRGRKPGGLDSRMERAVGEFEGTFEGKLEEWDGALETLVGAEDMLSDAMLHGGVVRFSRWVSRSLRPRALPRPLSFSGQILNRRRAGQSKRAGLRKLATRLRQRPELDGLNEEYRSMVATALEEVAEGRFTVCGFANIYMATIRHEISSPKDEAWWAGVLQLTRDVLQLWKWDPASQAWVSERDETAQTRRPETDVRILHGNVAGYPQGSVLSSSVRTLSAPSAAEDR